VRQLFQLGARESVCNAEGKVDEALIAVEHQMDAFCLYEVGKGPRVIPQAAALGLARLEPDAVAMTAAVQIPGKSGLLGRSIGPELEKYFVDQVGGAQASLRQEAGVSVRLAFLDSEPTGDGSTKRNQKMEHGHFLRLLGKKLAGERVKITTQLALPIVSFDPGHPEDSLRDTEGGYIGSFADLAEAIHAEVAAWQSQGPEHLVLNLSVGWDGERFGGLTETRVCDLPPGPRAVYLALEEAARQGVLIFAAAGNAQAGPHASTGPLLPAAWERGNIQESACGLKPDSPLLYAVGGLQAYDKPIANARQGGMPEFAAYADHVVVTDPHGTPTSTYTGTSVATAVVSSTAARIWSEQGGTIDSVIAKLKTGGKQLNYKADFYSEDQRPYVLRIDQYFSDAKRPTNDPVALKFPDEFTPSLRFEQTSRTSVDCDGTAVYGIGKASQNVLCPPQGYDDRWLDAWVIPQPDSDPCPSCAMGPPQRATSGTAPDRILHGEISEEWVKADEVLTTAMLDAVSSSGIRTYFTFDVPADYRVNPQFDIALSGANFSGGPPVKAVITWVVKSDQRITSINSPVLIYQ
jgi:hypothetical protein